MHHGNLLTAYKSRWNLQVDFVANKWNNENPSKFVVHFGSMAFLSGGILAHRIDFKFFPIEIFKCELPLYRNILPSVDNLLYIFYLP